MVAIHGFPIPCRADDLGPGDAFVNYGYRSAAVAIRVELGDEPFALILSETGATYESQLPSLVKISALEGSYARIPGEVLVSPIPPLRGAFASAPLGQTAFGQLLIGPEGLPIVVAARGGRWAYVSLGVTQFEGGSVSGFPTFDAWSLIWRDGTREQVLASFTPSTT